MADKNIMNGRTLTVKGVGHVKAKPDLAIISIVISTRMKDYARANEVALQKLDALRKAILSAGHEKQTLKITDFKVNTVENRYQDKNGNWQSKFEGYSCKHFLKLEFDFDMSLLGETLSKISLSESEPKLDISFSIKDKNAVQSELLANAIANATEKAKVLTKASGVTLSDIQSINYSWGEIYLSSSTMLNDYVYGFMSDSTLDDLEPKDVEANDTVTVVWEII